MQSDTKGNKVLAGAFVRCKYCNEMERVPAMLLEYKEKEKGIHFDWTCQECYKTKLLENGDVCDYRDFNGYYIHLHRAICEKDIREGKFQKNVIQPI